MDCPLGWCSDVAVAAIVNRDEGAAVIEQREELPAAFAALLLFRTIQNHDADTWRRDLDRRPIEATKAAPRRQRRQDYTRKCDLRR